MSFSSRMKEELAMKPCAKRERLCVLAGLTQLGGALKLGRGLRFSYTAEHLFLAKLIEKLVKAYAAVEVTSLVREQSALHARSYEIVLSGEGVAGLLMDTGVLSPRQKTFKRQIPKHLTGDPKSVKMFLRGAFLAAGTASDPGKRYHLEFMTHDGALAEALKSLLNQFDLNAKHTVRKERFVVYLKDGENIARLLALLGASNAILEFENARILKDIRNNLNRAVNCDTANMDKILDASLRQIEAIQRIDARMGLQALPPPLFALAEARLNHPDASLRELGELLGVGRSGIYHRLSKLDAIARELT